MSGSELMQKIGAPVAGALAIVLCIFVLDLGPILSVVIGLALWGFGHFAFMTGRRADPADNRENRREAELEDARTRLNEIRGHAGQINDASMNRSLDTIVGAAGRLIEDIDRNPADYGRFRRPLVHYLEHTEVIAERVTYLARAADPDDAVIAKARETLGDLGDLFREYNKRMLDDERLDLDTRIAVLEAEIAAEGVPAIARRRQARTATRDKEE